MTKNATFRDIKPLAKPAKEAAAHLVAEGRLSYLQIADKIDVHRATLDRWRKEEKFAARVEYLRTELNEAALQRAIARKEYRIGSLADRHSKLLEVLEDRGSQPQMKEVPGGATGLVVRQIIASSGELMGYEYAVDTGTLKELRAIEDQAAKELGQIVDKRELTGKDGSPLVPDITGQMTLEEIDARLKEILGISALPLPKRLRRFDEKTIKEVSTGSPAKRA